MASSPGRREAAVVRAFVEVADTPVDDADDAGAGGLPALAVCCADLLDVDDAGLLLADQDDELRVAGCSSDRARELGRFQLETGQGPGLDCVRTSQQVSAPDLEAVPGRWRRFSERARAAGVRSAHAVPLRRCERTIGALTLLRTAVRPIAVADLRLARALADVATVTIVQARALQQAEAVAGQLQTALHHRVVIEQAKGVLAERDKLDVAEAFTRLRAHARDHNQRLSDLARAVVDSATARQDSG